MAKPPRNTGALDAQVDLRDVLKAALAKVPGIGDVIEVVEKATLESRERRKAAWALYAGGGADGVGEFAKTLRDAFESKDGDVVRAGVLEGARAAVDAVDDSVIPTIGLLTRRRLQTRTPDLRTYRELIGMFRSMDAEEYEALRTMVRALSTMLTTTENLSAERDVPTVLRLERERPSDPREWVLWARIPYIDSYMSIMSHHALVRGPQARMIVSVLEGRERRPFEKDPESEGPHLTRPMIEHLRAIVPH